MDLFDYGSAQDPGYMAQAIRARKRGDDQEALAGATAASRRHDLLAAIAQMSGNRGAASAALMAQKNAQQSKPDQLGSTGYMLPDTGQFVESPMYADEKAASREAVRSNQEARLAQQSLEGGLTRAMQASRLQQDAEHKERMYGLAQYMAELRKQGLDNAADARRARQADTGQRDADRKKRDLDLHVTKYSNALTKEAIPEFGEALDIAEARLTKHKDGDLPGYGRLTSGLHMSMLNDEGQMSRTDLQQAANILLKARSGAAVTDSEMRRFLTEVATGVGMSEKALRNGWANVRRSFDAKRGAVAAGASPEAQEEFIGRGGRDYRVEALPAGVTAEEWKHMTPAERKLFK